MDKMSFYTKGDNNTILSRISQVHTITVYCPLNDFCVKSLYDTFEIMLSKYRSSENIWSGVPTIDALNAFLFTSAFQEKFAPSESRKILELIISSLKMFNRLKLINFNFTDDEDVKKGYELFLETKKVEDIKYFYKVEQMELNLSDMFAQCIIDLLNKVFMHNGLIPNSYLERKYFLNFEFDEYTSFMHMFLSNNNNELNSLDKNICDYLGKFPKIIEEHKPNIRIITNYSD